MRPRKRINFEKSDFTPMFRHFTNLLINRVVVNNLPEEINEKFFLYHVLLFGRILFFKKNGKYHVMWFSGKGHLDEYYIQKDFLIVNPWAKETSGDYDEKNAVIVYSDINAYIENADVGLYDFIEKYSTIINAIDASINALAKNSKVIAFLTGSTKSFVTSAKEVIKNLLNSEDCIGVMEESLVDSIKVNPISEKMDYKFSELIKARQYYISDFYQKIGISANMNMKAERLTDNESQLIDAVSDVDFEHILDNLNYSISFVNELFGLDISFSLNEDPQDNSSVVDNTDENGDEDDGTGTDSNTGDGVQRTESSAEQSGVSGEQDVSNRSVDGSSGTETESLDENSDEQRDDSEVSDNTEEENNEIEVNGVNVEVNINVPTDKVEVDSDTVDDNSSDSDDSSVVDNSDEDEKEEVKKNETSNA